ncbi:hypothetical protein [Chelativorans sp. AA-79]|uniref:hypothetical protein n=1 Tax=Chelativorans sp. AA-79 TaxID=3028735 RepID=UPI0023F69A7C|nr:hypothetical protein [Chelativorans sp. AA-79]WEX12429.1 hypothetical protein PVE73_27460 [Chelativorans sp. AA-79]
MLLRYGFYEGYVREEDQAEFDEMVGGQMVPDLSTMPGVLSVRLMRGTRVGELAPRWYHAIELGFEDEQGLLAAMNSDIRRDIARRPTPALKLFIGRTPHANFRLVRSLPGPSSRS